MSPLTETQRARHRALWHVEAREPVGLTKVTEVEDDRGTAHKVRDPNYGAFLACFVPASADPEQLVNLQLKGQVTDLLLIPQENLGALVLTSEDELVIRGLVYQVISIQDLPTSGADVLQVIIQRRTI